VAYIFVVHRDALCRSSNQTAKNIISLDRSTLFWKCSK